MTIKKVIKSIPGAVRINDYRKQLEAKRAYSTFIKDSQQIDARIKNKKITGQKINILFICHRPSVWGAQKTIYENIILNRKFDVKIIAIPKVNRSMNTLDDEGAAEFFSQYGAINGYVNGEFIDLKQFNPDFVFFQQPYNVSMPDQYSSKVVSKYAHICYISYFAFTKNVTSYNVFHSCVPKDFFENITLYFTQSDYEQYLVKEWLNNTPNNIHFYTTGYPKFDDASKYKNIESPIWQDKSKKLFRTIWTPRWCTNENNSHFFDYKDLILKYCLEHPEIEIAFRPHPQSWYEWERTGELSADEAQEYKSKYESLSNAHIDTSKEYLSMFYSSNCLVTDFSSVIPEYFLTGNPIIYCDNKKSKMSFVSTEDYGESFYWAYSWNDVEKYLNMLINGNDPLKEKRMYYINHEFNIFGKKSGYLICDKIENYIESL